MDHLNDRQISLIKMQLIKDQADVKRRLEVNLSDQMTRIDDSISTADNHPADLGTDLFEQTRNNTLNDHAQAHLRETETALARIEEQTYGYCVVCEQPINYERLLAVPTTVYCIEHVPKQTDRYEFSEELSEPSYLFQTDEHDDLNAWKMVEQFGTASTPAFLKAVDDYDESFEDEDHSLYIDYE